MAIPASPGRFTIPPCCIYLLCRWPRWPLAGFHRSRGGNFLHTLAARVFRKTVCTLKSRRRGSSVLVNCTSTCIFQHTFRLLACFLAEHKNPLNVILILKRRQTGGGNAFGFSELQSSVLFLGRLQPEWKLQLCFFCFFKKTCWQLKITIYQLLLHVCWFSRKLIKWSLADCQIFVFLNPDCWLTGEDGGYSFIPINTIKCIRHNSWSVAPTVHLMSLSCVIFHVWSACSVFRLYPKIPSRDVRC